MKLNSACLPRATGLGMILLSVVLRQSAEADVQTWWGAGATANWSDASGNWTNAELAASVPANGDDLVFANAIQTTSTNDISSLSANSLTFTTGDFDLFGNPLTVGSGITNSSGDNIFDLPLTLGASQTFEVDAASLTFDAAITNTSYNLTFTGSGVVNLSGSGLGLVTGGGMLTMSGTGTMLITNKQPLTGGIVVNSGTMQFAPIGNLVFGGAITPSLITINPGGTVYNSTVHAIGGGTPLFINGGIWELDAEDYKQTLTMQDGTIQAGPNGGEIRPGLSGAAGPYTWYFTNSVSGSVINNPINTEPGSVPVNLILDVARGSAASDLTISGVIKNGGNITVVRNGITTLTGANTQTGTFTIAGGTVVLQNTLMSSVITVASNAVFDISGTSFSLNNGSTLAGSGTVLGTLYDNNSGVVSILSPGGNGVAGTLTMGGLSLSGNGLQLSFDLAGTTGVGGGTNDLLIATNFSASGGVTNLVNLSFNGTPQTGVPYTLIKYGNGFSGDPSQFLVAQASRYTYTFINNQTLGAIQVIVTGSPGNLIWAGDSVANNWDVNTSSNWLLGAASSAFLQGDNVIFNDAGSVNPPVNLAGAVQPTSVTFNSTHNYTLAGIGNISSGSLVKNNSGNLTILTTNTSAAGGILNGSGTVTVGNGGPNSYSIGSGLLTNNTKVTIFENASSTYSGSMSGTGSLTAFVPGSTLTLTGTNTFTGGLTVANGTVQIGNNTAGASPSVAGNITNYGTLNIYRADAFTNKNNITSAGNTLEYGNGDINVRGAGGMTVDGSGSVNALPAGSLSVGQSASGMMTVNPGAVINVGLNYLFGNPNAVGNWGTVTQNGGTISVGNQVRIGHWASEVSTNIMNGGVLNVPNAQLAVGWDGIGFMIMSNGTVNCRSLTVDDDGFTAAINGLVSTFAMSGGLLNIGVGGIGGNVQTNTDVNNIRLSGGTIAAVAPAGYSSSVSMVLTNGSPTFDTTNTTVTLSGILSGNGGLIKQGTGYLNLNGANTFTNTVTVAAGTLQGTGTNIAPIVVQSGANLSAGGTLATGTMTASNVTFNTGANLVIDASTTSSNSDLVYVKGTLTFATNTPLVMNFLGGTPYTGNPYTVVSNLLPRAGSGNLVLAPSGLTRYAASVTSNPNNIQVSFTGANASLVWQGSASTNWNVNTDADWLNAGVADKYYQSDVVLFDDTGISKSNINVTAAVTPASVSVDTAGSYTFYGSPISGITALTKSGTGTLTLLNNNSYTGLTTVSAGTLQVGNGTTLGQLPLSGTVDDYGSLVFNHSDLVNFNGTINGPGHLTQAGSGTLLITATQNHYGGTTINPGGTVQLGNGILADAGSLGNGPVTNNGTVNFYRASSIGVGASYTGGGALNFLGTGNSGQSAYSLTATNTFTGPVTVNLARIQSGAGAQSFGSPSSLVVNPGSAVYATATAQSPAYNMPLTIAGTGWQDGLGALRMEANGTWAGNVTLAANARIATTSASTNTVTGDITGNYELETYGNNAAGAVVLAPASANSFNALRVSIGTAGTKTIAGNNNAIPNNIPLTMNGGTLWLSGFSKSFSSFLNLSSSSSIQNGSATSRALVALAPPVGVSSYSGTFADGGAKPLDVTINQGNAASVVSLTGSSAAWTGNFTNNGGAIIVNGQNTFLGVNNVPTRTIALNNCTMYWTINNILSGGNSTEPTLVLNNSTINSTHYNALGPIFLNGSTLTGVDNGDAGYYNWVLPGGSVAVGGSAPSYMLGTGSGNGFCLATPTVFNVAHVTGSSAPDLTVSAPLRSGGNGIGGSGALTKSGAGTMLVDGAATYTGPTVINNGTLALSVNGSLVLSPSIAINNGSTFDVSQQSGGVLSMAANQVIAGNGTINGSLSDGTTTVIQPGSATAAGTLTITTNLTLGGAGSLNVNLAGSTTVGGGVNSLIRVNGNLTLSGSTPMPVDFNFLNGTPAVGTPYTLFQCNGTISGTTATAFANSTRYTASFAQAGNAITVTFNGAVSNLVWTGTDPITPATWDVNNSTNWSNGSGLDVFYQSDSVRFDDTSTANTVTINSTVAPAAITVDSTNDYTFSGTGTIGGSAGITKNNTNTLFLETVGTFTGPIVVNAGTVADGKNGTEVLAPGVNVIVSNNAAFDFNGGSGNFTTYGHTFVIAGSGPTGNGALLSSVDDGGEDNYVSVSNLILTADSVVGGIERWDIGSDPSSMLNGQGHNLTIAGTGNGKIDIRAQIITNMASITISNPLVYYESFNQTNPWTLGTTNFVKPGSRLGIYGGFQFNLPIELDGGTLTNQGNGTPAWLSAINVASTSGMADGGAQNFYGVISGPGAINIGGSTATGLLPGAVTFSNSANAFAGGLVISNAPMTHSNVAASVSYAAVVASTANALGTGPILFDLSLMTTNTATNTARALECNIPGGGVLPNAIVLPAASTLVTNVGIQGRDSTSVFTLSGQISGGFAGLTNWFDSGTAGSVGVTRLANTGNNFVANIYVPRGELAVTGDGCLGSAANILKLDQGVAAVTTANGLRFDAPGINLAHIIMANSGTAFDLWGDNNGDGVLDTVNNATISGIVSGAGTIYIRGTNGTLTLSGPNTCTGGFEMQQPVTLQVSASTNLGTAYVGIKAGSTFRYTGTGSETMTRILWSDGGGTAGGGTIDIPSATASLTWNPSGGTCNQGITKTGAGALTYGTQSISGGYLAVNNGAMTVNSAISGTYTPIYANGGTLTLNGNNTCLGGVYVGGGTLLVNGSVPAGNAVVASSGTLGGSGVINCPVTVQPGATLQPGAGGAAVGKLTVNAPLNLGGNTVMYLNKSALTNSQVAGPGTVIYGGTLNVNSLGGTYVAGDKFTLFSAGNHVGGFFTVNLPALSGGLAWSNSLAIDGSIQVVATVNTSPTSIATSISGNTLTLNWPADHTGWRLLVQTNTLGTGLNPATNAWYTVPGSASVNSENITMDPAKGSVFYQLVYP